jgi:hypothetical protein
MTQKQLAAHRTGILAHARHLVAQGVPFEDFRVGQLLDAAILLGRKGVPRQEWEEVYHAILDLWGQQTAA